MQYALNYSGTKGFVLRKFKKNYSISWWFTVAFVQRASASTRPGPPEVNYTPTTCQWEIQNSVFRMPIIQALKTWYKLSRVTLCKDDLRRNKHYFELARGSTYQEPTQLYL